MNFIELSNDGIKRIIGPILDWTKMTILSLSNFAMLKASTGSLLSSYSIIRIWRTEYRVSPKT